MRVTSTTMPDLVRNQLNMLTGKQAKLQNQISTGQHIQKASDEPDGFLKVMEFQSESRSITQFRKNIDTYKELSTTNYSVVDSLNKLVNRAQEIATIADELKSPEELKIYSIEVNELINQALLLANTESRNQYIFGGTVTDNPPFEKVTDASGDISSVNYTGNESPQDIIISNNLRTQAHIPGQNESGTGPFGLFKDIRNESDIFKSLIDLRDNLRSGDATKVQTESIPALKKDEENLIYQIGFIGSTQGHMESISGMLSEKNDSLNALSSSEADVDLTETILLLNQNSVAYQAALQAAGKILNTSLLDYIR